MKTDLHSRHLEDLSPLAKCRRKKTHAFILQFTPTPIDLRIIMLVIFIT